MRDQTRIPTHHLRVTPGGGGLGSRAQRNLFRSLDRRLGGKVEFMKVVEFGSRRALAHVHYLLRVGVDIPSGLVGEVIGRAAPGSTHSCTPLRHPLAAVDYVLKAGKFSDLATVPPRGKGRLVSFTRGFLGKSPRALWQARQRRRRAEKG
jgi:hypothetical protein